MKTNEVCLCSFVILILISCLECEPGGGSIEDTLVKDILEKAFALRKDHASNKDITKKDTVAVNQNENLERRVKTMSNISL